MMKRALLLVLAGVAAGGCTTIYSEDQAVADAHVDMSIQSLQAKVGRLDEQLQAMEAERQDLYARIDRLENGSQSSRQGDQERLASLERSMASYEAARQRDRDEIVDQLSRKMADMVKPSSGGGGGGSHGVSTGARTAEGYEHVVKPGETLSAIAAAYGVKPSTIMQANGLKNANSLRAGQKLFIPE